MGRTHVSSLWTHCESVINMLNIKSLISIEDRKKSDSTQVEVLFVNENYLFVNKSYDLLINDDRSENTLHLRLQKQFPHLVCKNIKFLFYFPHRLDYSTSGVICIALNKKACATMCSNFEKNNCRKYYLALLRGIVSQEIIDVKHPIGINTSEINKSNKMCSPEFSSECFLPRSAHTRLLVLSYGHYDRYPCTKVLIRLFTGRRHQIRVHCSNIGHTIVGDYTYSNRKDVRPKRQMLHSHRLHVPTLGDGIDIRTEDPFDINVLTDWTPFKHVNNFDENVFTKIDS